MKFWDVIKEVSAQSVRQEARRSFVLALAGEAAAIDAALERIWGPSAGPAVREAGAPFLFRAEPPYPLEAETRLRIADLLVSLPGGPGPTDLMPADTLLVPDPAEIVPKVLTHRPDLRVSLARRFPGFRELAADHVIRDVSRVNAEFAAVSSISSAIPILAPLFPAGASADVLMLTKNQVLMIFRLAAIYGEELDLRSRLREVLPVIGGGLGWRTIARQIAGVLPGGLGLPVKAGIAYSGTYAVGRVAQIIFDEGRRPERQEMLRIYEEGSHLAKAVVASLRDRLSRRDVPSAPAPPKALPAETERVTTEEPSERGT